jgi:2-hydroxycyclohexanecarboxyl-CoA dehydrogenase
MPTTIVAGPDSSTAEDVALAIAGNARTRPVLVGPGSDAHRVPAVEADLRRPESAAAAIRRVVDAWGPPEAVVVVPPSVPPRRFQEVDPELWGSTLDGVLTATMHVSRYAAPALVRAGGGAIALVTWEVGPGSGLVHAAAASGAVHLMARALAVELGPFGVRVNAVSAPPGGVEAAVPAVRLLLSPEAAYVTGEVIGASSNGAPTSGSASWSAGWSGDGVALVTGAGRGIGAAVAERLAREGLPVAVNGLEPGEIERTVARIVASGGVAAPFPADVADPRAVDEMVGSVEDWRGPVRVLVNNAGVLQMSPFLDMDLGLWHRVLAVNLGGVVNCARRVLPGMCAAGFGRIVNVASFWGLVGVAGAAHYCASKGGIVALTRALADEVAEFGVAVSAVAPGTVDTEQLAADAAFAGLSLAEMKERYAAEAVLGRIATPEEMAGIVAALASKQGGAFNGRTLVANGGRRVA